LTTTTAIVVAGQENQQLPPNEFQNPGL